MLESDSENLTEPLVSSHPAQPGKPDYEHYGNMAGTRAPLGALFARQILATCRPFLPAPLEELDILDVGCGYGDTALELARACRHVVGIEPNAALFAQAQQRKNGAGPLNLDFRSQSLYDLPDVARYHLVVLDNVFEHLPDQPLALRIISACLRPGGVAFLLMPNKLWPVEVHYRLPFLSYLPLRLANFYLRITRRGNDYTDASYAPTYFRLRRLLNARPELSYQFVLPGDPAATMAGAAPHYRLGMAALRRFPFLWVISKSFLVIAVKHDHDRTPG